MVTFRRGADAFSDVVGVGIPASMVLVSRAAAGLAGVLASLGIIGWIVDGQVLERIIPGTAPARFNAAVAVGLLAAAWFVPAVGRAIASSAALVIALLTVFEQITTVNLGIDQLVIAGGSGQFPGRMTLMASASLALIAVAQLLPLARRARLAQRLAVLVLLVSFVVLLGLSYSVTLRAVSTVSAATAASLVLLSVATFAAVPDGGMSWAVTGQDPGATLIRRLTPLAVVGFPLVGLLCVLVGRAGGLSSSETSALIVVLSGMALASFAWAAARRVSRVDRGRAQAIAELTDLRLDLERQVQERASQLQNGRNEIAVLEDRQRIAADLHDIVIQRLFAAGMYLQSGVAGVDEETRRRLNSAVESMDDAIKDLRASIFELGGRQRVRIDITTAISEVCTESARVLGFEPEIVIDDPEEEAEQFRDDILAVIREALANVARHAQASSVDVVLRTGEGQVWLAVTDNGRGIITESSRRSGTRNIAQRAREYGGDCVWTRVQPTGTRVLWRVPLEPDAQVVHDDPPGALATSGVRRPAPGPRWAW